MGSFKRGIPFLAILATMLGGCADLLPTARSDAAGPWRTFDEAASAIETIVPYRTTGGELRSRGIDPLASANVQLLTYSDIVLRFPVTASIPRERLDQGLRECLEAGKACTGYALTARAIKRDRVGDFWLDSLNFKRVVEMSGWNFNALILLVDDRVVFATHGGQPKIHETEITRQPLGPVQSWGSALPLLVQ